MTVGVIDIGGAEAGAVWLRPASVTARRGKRGAGDDHAANATFKRHHENPFDNPFDGQKLPNAAASPIVHDDLLALVLGRTQGISLAFFGLKVPR